MRDRDQIAKQQADIEHNTRLAQEAALGIGGAPTRATTLPTDPEERKRYPVASGVLDYFPDAIVAVSHLSQRGNEQHNAGQPLHWNRGKSADEADTLIRHFLQRGTLDTDGLRHSAKVAWRALALLQKEIEAEAAQQQATPLMSGRLGSLGRLSYAQGPQTTEPVDESSWSLVRDRERY